ncbi:CHAT domain-containing protein [Candidatus Electrothrix laxa]
MGQTKILLFTALPTGKPLLRVDREIKQIEQGLRLSEQRDRFILKTSQAVTVPDVRRAMQQHRPQIVHFSGHGEGVAGLCFENEYGEIQFVHAEALSDFFSRFTDQVRCIVLNACYSEVQAEAIARHIDYVIGMNDSISDKAAIAFSGAFYESLGNGEAIESAYTFACTELNLLNLKEEHIPKLIHRKPSEEPKNMQVTMQSNQSNAEHIQRLIAEDRLKMALAEFFDLAAVSDVETRQELIAHQAALAKVTKERRRGLLDAGKEEQVRNRIRYALLDLLQEHIDR